VSSGTHPALADLWVQIAICTFLYPGLNFCDNRLESDLDIAL